MIRPPPWTDGPRDGTTYLLLPFHGFFTHTLTGGRREAGRRSRQPQDYALSLQPKKRACLPSPCPPQLRSCSTCHAVDGGVFFPPQTPCQLDSMFAMSIRLPDGTVPTFPLTGLLWDWAQCSPLRKHLGPSLQPLWRPLVSSVSATVWVERALPPPLREPAGRDGGFLPHTASLCPSRLLTQLGLCTGQVTGAACPALPCLCCHGPAGALGLKGTTISVLFLPLVFPLLPAALLKS